MTWKGRPHWNHPLTVALRGGRSNLDKMTPERVEAVRAELTRLLCEHLGSVAEASRAVQCSDRFLRNLLERVGLMGLPERIRATMRSRFRLRDDDEEVA